MKKCVSLMIFITLSFVVLTGCETSRTVDDIEGIWTGTVMVDEESYDITFEIKRESQTISGKAWGSFFGEDIIAPVFGTISNGVAALTINPEGSPPIDATLQFVDSGAAGTITVTGSETGGVINLRKE